MLNDRLSKIFLPFNIFLIQEYNILFYFNTRTTDN